MDFWVTLCAKCQRVRSYEPKRPQVWHKVQATLWVRHTPYSVCALSAPLLGLTASDGPVVKLCGTPFTKGIQTCLSFQGSEGEASSTIAEVQAGYQVGSGSGASGGQRHDPHSIGGAVQGQMLLPGRGAIVY